MSNDLVKIEEQHIPDIWKELDEAFFDIPFENSAFQTQAFVIAAQLTPARAYRVIGLRMFSKIQAVKEHLYQLEMSNIDLDEKSAKLNDPSTNEYDKRRLRLEIARIESSRGYPHKLYNDALHELSLLYAQFKKLPRYTREQFEDEETLHFKKRLTRQMQNNGNVESLLNMEQDLPNWESTVTQAKIMLDNPEAVRKLVTGKRWTRLSWQQSSVRS